MKTYDFIIGNLADGPFSVAVTVRDVESVDEAIEKLQATMKAIESAGGPEGVVECGSDDDGNVSMYFRVHPDAVKDRSNWSTEDGEDEDNHQEVHLHAD